MTTPLRPPTAKPAGAPQIYRAKKAQMRGRRSVEGELPSPARPAVHPAELHAMIAEAAYFCAERRGFDPGHEIDDWLQAERDVERALGLRSRR